MTIMIRIMVHSLPYYDMDSLFCGGEAAMSYHFMDMVTGLVNSMVCAIFAASFIL